jgi:hypothetical protein
MEETCNSSANDGDHGIALSLYVGCYNSVVIHLKQRHSFARWRASQSLFVKFLARRLVLAEFAASLLGDSRVCAAVRVWIARSSARMVACRRHGH